MIDNQWNSCETYEVQRGEFTGTSLKQPADTFHHNVKSYGSFQTGQRSWYSKALPPADNDDGKSYCTILAEQRNL